MALHADILALGAPIETNLVLMQGDGRSFLRTLRKRNSDGSYTPYDITGWTFRLQVRASYDAGTVLIAATVAPTSNAALGEYSETWDPAQTASLAAGATAPEVDIGVYDLDVSHAGQTVTLKRGRAILKTQVSRA